MTQCKNKLVLFFFSQLASLKECFQLVGLKEVLAFWSKGVFQVAGLNGVFYLVFPVLFIMCFAFIKHVLFDLFEGYVFRISPAMYETIIYEFFFSPKIVFIFYFVTSRVPGFARVYNTGNSILVILSLSVCLSVCLDFHLLD